MILPCLNPARPFHPDRVFDRDSHVAVVFQLEDDLVAVVDEEAGRDAATARRLEGPLHEPVKGIIAVGDLLGLHVRACLVRD
jgi:hypothetical protein